MVTGTEGQPGGARQREPSTHYPVAVGVVEGLELDDIGMAHDAHNLKLTVLSKSVDQYCPPHVPDGSASHLETLVLEDSLDGSVLAAGGHLGLKHHTERSIAHDLALGVRDLLGFARQAILDLFADDLCAAGEQDKLVGNTAIDGRKGFLPPMRKLGKSPGRLCDMVGWGESVCEGVFYRGRREAVLRRSVVGESVEHSLGGEGRGSKRRRGGGVCGLVWAWAEGPNGGEFEKKRAKVPRMQEREE